MATTRRLEKVVGTVEPRRVRRGTASEHDALVLTTEEGETLILQRVGANPFADARTRKLEGRHVCVSGYRVGSVFRFVRVDEE